MEAVDWLLRAERDLEAARRLLEPEPPLSDVAVYHAQQAAEKALKAFLTSHRRPVRKTHDLVALLAECIALDQRFSQFLGAAQTLGPYATQFR
ncbi:MAG: HEPN domain-containing protein, partial [Chloroflexi bacterium]